MDLPFVNKDEKKHLFIQVLTQVLNYELCSPKQMAGFKSLLALQSELSKYLST